VRFPVTMLPTPLRAYYEWGDDRQRETYLVLGVATTTPEREDAAALYHATWLLVIRDDGKPTWLSLGRLTFEERP
jgi:hypothetical protein